MCWQLAIVLDVVIASDVVRCYSSSSYRALLGGVVVDDHVTT